MSSDKHFAAMTAALCLVGQAVLSPFVLVETAGAEPPPSPSNAASEDSPEPWDLSGPPRPFDETCFDDFRDSGDGLTEKDAAGWLRPVEGLPLKLTESNNTYGRAVTVGGLAKLRSPWSNDAVLRVSFDTAQRFMLHFWQPGGGVTLRWYSDAQGRGWAAYRTTRRPGKRMTVGGEQLSVADADLALLATDGRRSGRTAGGTYAVRHQDGSLVVTKGDVRMLTVAMSAPPEEVYLQCDSVLLRELAVFRGGPVPENRTDASPTVIRGDRPARMHWQENLPPGAELRRLGDGRVELAARDTETEARAFTRLIRPGLYEVVFEVDDASPGTGVYLGDERGEPIERIGFYRDAANGSTAVNFDRPDTAALAKQWKIDTTPIPYIARRQRLRVVLGCRTLKCFLSSDGIHWSQALAPLPNVNGPYRSIGLYGSIGPGTRTVTLRRLQVRRLDTICTLASIELLQPAQELPFARHGVQNTDIGAWQQRVCESQPDAVDAGAWRRSCAVAALAGGCGPPLSNALLDRLLEEGLGSQAPLQWKLRLLEDAALLYDVSTQEDTQRFVEHCACFGRVLSRDEDQRAFDVVRRLLMTIPLRTQYGIKPIVNDLARTELISLVYRGKWEDVHRLCRQLSFWDQPAALSPNGLSSRGGLARLVNWADIQSRRKRPGKQKPPLPGEWQHPLVVYLSKEGYNIQAELHVALREKSYKAARKILTAATMPQDWGLIADLSDQRLFESLPTAIAAAMDRYPRLREVMRDEFKDLDRLRLRRAMTASNVAEIQGLTVQYHGTPAAAEAHCWLGDRLMAEGRFMMAGSHYRQALPAASPEQRASLQARIRLAGAMLGRDTGQPVTQPVEFRDTRLTAAEFEDLVAAMLARHAADGAGDLENGTAVGAQRAPPPARFQPRPWADFSGGAGLRPEQVPAAAQPLDWPARQMATATTGKLMIAANRFQVVAYELATGTVKWTYALGEEQGPTHSWPFLPMRPKLSGNRVYVRMVNKQSRPEMVCLDLGTGEHLWTSRYPGYVASDPLLMYGQLFALTVASTGNQPVRRLTLTAFDPASGDVLGEHPLVDFHGEQNLLGTCQAVVVLDRIVVAAAGAVVCCDTFGQVRWVRRCPWLSKTLGGDHSRQYYQPPLVLGDRIYVAQPGVQDVECIDLDIGRLHWSLSLPDVRRLLQLDDDRLLIETANGIRAVSAKTGEKLWRHDAENLLDGYLSGGTEGLLYTQGESAGADRYTPTLVWLDPATGHTKGSCRLPSLTEKRATIGPLVSHGDRLWCFAGVFDEKGKLGPERKVLELVAAGPARSSTAKEFALWTSAVDAKLRSLADDLLPGWTLLSAGHDAKTGRQPLVAGLKDVLVTKADATPTRLAARLAVPRGGKARLVLLVGHDPASQSVLEIRAGRHLLLQVSPRPTTTAAQWQKLEVDLSAHAGRNGWITIVQRQASTAPGYTYWKHLKIE